MTAWASVAARAPVVGVAAMATRESAQRKLAARAADAMAALAAANAGAGADTDAKPGRPVLNYVSSIQCGCEPSGELPCALLSRAPSRRRACDLKPAVALRQFRLEGSLYSPEP